MKRFINSISVTLLLVLLLCGCSIDTNEIGEKISDGIQQGVEAVVDEVKDSIVGSDYAEKVHYDFRRPKNLTEHFEKHGEEMGIKSESDYLERANAVINNPASLHKHEAEDGDDVYFLESTGEIVFLSQDGYIRTYFISDKDYYDRQ